MTQHQHPHAFANFHGREAEGLVVPSRRNFLKAGWAGLAGLTLPGLLQARDQASAQGRLAHPGKSVILLWMAGGPSHIDTWDPKPDRPPENRGPFGVIRHAACPASSFASTCRSRRPCSTSSPSFARSTPGTAITSRTRSFRPATSRPHRASIRQATSIRPSARWSPSTMGRTIRPCPPTWHSCSRARTSPGAGYLGKTIRSVPRRLGGQAAGLRHRRRRLPADLSGADLFTLPEGLLARAVSGTALAPGRRSTSFARISTVHRRSWSLDRYGQQAVDCSWPAAAPRRVRP